MQQFSTRTKIKLLFTQFLAPHPMELLVYLFVSLFILLVASNQTLLVILADGSPVQNIPVTEVFGQRLNYIGELLQVPILGRAVLFLFWLAIGSVVYMAVWLIQNLAIEVYDDLAMAKLKDRSLAAKEQDEEGWWGTTLSHTIFVCSSVILLLFFVIIAVNFLFPAWVQLFQIGLQSLSEAGGMLKMLLALLGSMITVHIFVLFWRVFFRLKSYIYNAF